MSSLENEEELAPFDPWPAEILQAVPKRTHSSAFPEGDSDSDCDPGFISYADELNRAMCRSERDWSNRKKGRQGRSRESRERAKRAREETREMLLDQWDDCKDCKKFDFLEDGVTGDVVCSNCGLVQSAKGLEFCSNIAIRVKNKSKPYQRVVHFRQRYAQLVGTDPWISEELFEDILFKTDELGLTGDSFGKKSFSKVLKELNPKTKRLSANWIQVRRRMGLETPSEVEDPDLLYKRLCARYQCIDVVFQEKLWNAGGEKDALHRRNIVNVNYLIAQMLRLESEDLFRAWGKFLPQLSSKKQPWTNNARWKILTQELQGRFKLFSNRRTEERIPLTWEYKELTKEDIDLYCSGFH